MINKEPFILLLLIFITSCSVQRKAQNGSIDKQNSPETICDSINSYKTLYINKINAKITLDEENYDARVSLYYVPDSIFFLSAVNSGFEIVRIGIMKDSTIYINRLDKMMLIYKEKEFGASPPVDFNDFELLINRAVFCTNTSGAMKIEEEFIVDYSTQNIEKRVFFSAVDLSLKKFEFFQKKTSEYVVGERTGESGLSIYSNYIVDDLMMKTSGGMVEYDKELNINLEVNRSKYEIIYF